MGVIGRLLKFKKWYIIIKMSLYLRGHTQFLFLTETFQITPPFCLNMCSLVMDLIESGLLDRSVVFSGYSGFLHR